ncbi:MAG: SDR family NAD(P)-dependent oxidoreductase [Myxococcales bacterium]|nr:SDR family NAD(P)-dependent oxidoreductase [Myxococcales bacterium]MDD9965059.1 SDR family NAD(P)-dependent oxidoreductase [Myxococcales bacterium]
MHILVTGGAGFIGSHLCEALLARGDTVVALDNFNSYYDPARKRAALAEIRRGSDPVRFRFFEGDIRDRAFVDELVARERIDAIAHLAAMAGVRASIGQALLYEAVNVMGTLHVLEAARLHGIDRVVCASTSSVYGNTTTIPFVESDPCDLPLAPYPASKRSVELLGHTYYNLHGMHFTALRFFTVYGPRNRPDMMAHLLLDNIVHGKPVQLYGGGQMWRDWTYVGDIVDGVMAALDRPLGYEVINLGRGEPVLLKDFVMTLEQLAGGASRLDKAPVPAADVERTFAKIDKAKRLLDYSPSTTLEVGAQHLWRWYQTLAE